MKKILIAVVSIIGILIAIFGFTVVYTGSTKDIVAVADKFQPGEGWVLKSEQVEPPRLVCLGGVACPSLHRTWVVEEDMTREAFTETLQSSGIDFEIDGDCKMPINLSGTGVPVCFATGRSGSYEVVVSAVKSQSMPNQTYVGINVSQD